MLDTFQIPTYGIANTSPLDMDKETFSEWLGCIPEEHRKEWSEKYNAKNHQAPSIIKSLYAKVGAQLYSVELKYKVNGLFCLRPITGEPYKWLLLPAERVRNLQLFPIFGA